MLPKALGQASFHKGTERPEGPVPALLKELGQAPPFPYGERAIPALLKALGQVPPFPYGERPIPALLEALG